MYQLDHLWKNDSWYQWSRGRVPLENVELGLFFSSALGFYQHWISFAILSPCLSSNVKAFCSSSQLTVDLIILNNCCQQPLSPHYSLFLPDDLHWVSIHPALIHNTSILVLYGSTAIIRAILIIKFLYTLKHRTVSWRWNYHTMR